MPRPWEYSPTRRIAMQITMWLVFAATLGVAQIVSSHRARIERMDLDEPISVGDVRLRLPRDFEVTLQGVDSLAAKDLTHHRNISVEGIALTNGERLDDCLARRSPVPLRSVERLKFPGLHKVGLLARGHQLIPLQD